jgi:hypothetical protein
MVGALTIHPRPTDRHGVPAGARPSCVSCSGDRRDVNVQVGREFPERIR